MTIARMIIQILGYIWIAMGLYAWLTIRKQKDDMKIGYTIAGFVFQIFGIAFVLISFAGEK